MRNIMEFPVLETYTEERAFCGLVGHYHHFIRNFACLACTLYDLLGDEGKMVPVTVSPEAQDVGETVEREDSVHTRTGVL